MAGGGISEVRSDDARSYDATEVLGSVKGARSGHRGSVARQTNTEAAANAYSLNFAGAEDQIANIDADSNLPMYWPSRALDPSSFARASNDQRLGPHSNPRLSLVL